MAHESLSAAQTSLESVADDLFSGRYSASEVQARLVDMHRAVLRAADDESIPKNLRRMLLVSFGIFKMTVAFIANDNEQVENRRNDTVRFYDKDLETDKDILLIWWFIGALRYGNISTIKALLQKHPNSINVEKYFLHKIIDMCLRAIDDNEPFD